MAIQQKIKPGKGIKQYRLLQEIVIPAGTILGAGSTAITRFVPFAEYHIEHNKDVTSEWSMPIGDALDLGLIEEVKS